MHAKTALAHSLNRNKQAEAWAHLSQTKKSLSLDSNGTTHSGSLDENISGCQCWNQTRTHHRTEGNPHLKLSKNLAKAGQQNLSQQGQEGGELSTSVTYWKEMEEATETVLDSQVTKAVEPSGWGQYSCNSQGDESGLAPTTEN